LSKQLSSNKAYGWFGIILLLVVIIFALSTAQCAVSKKPQQNALGFLQYEDNPYVYLEGNINAAAYVDKEAVVIRMQPRGTYALFTQDVLLCPGAAELINNKSNPMVIVYERTAHQLIDGVGCHELRFVDEVTKKKEIQ
jgi:hypothetical protein